MGVKFDPEVNRGVRGKDVVLSAPDSRVKVVTIATNEELVIASDTFRLTKNAPNNTVVAANANECSKSFPE